MNIVKQNKVVFIVAIVLILFVVFYSLSSGSSDTSDQTTSATPATGNTGEREMLELLTDMQTIRLDGRIFESDTYVNLQDFSREIIPEPIGRQDPFAPLENTEITITGGEELSDQVLLR